MNKLLSLPILGLMMAAAPAFAMPVPPTTGLMSVNISATLPQSCAFDSSNSKTTYVLSNDSRTDSGKIAYSCNYIGTPTVTITSANGGLTPDSKAVANGAALVPYQLVFGDRATANGAQGGMISGSFTQAVSSQTDALGWTSTAAANQAVNPTFAIYLTNPMTVAGSYSDTVTITIAP